MPQPNAVESPETALPSRSRLFLWGALGLLPAVALALAVEAGLRAAAGDGRVGESFFIAAAVLLPVLALGLLIQLITALTRRTRDLMREFKRFDEEMSAEPPLVNEESHRQRQVTWEQTTLFKHALVPFGAGVALQLCVAEIAAIACAAAGTDDRLAAIALGAEVVALFGYLVFFNVALARATGTR